MNIFYLHKDAYISAKAMTNKHVVKMILESAQLLSTAHHVLDNDSEVIKMGIYKKTHVNHPSAIWVRESAYNYIWLRNHLIALLDEYAMRYNKKPTDHKTYNVMMNLFYPPKNIPWVDATPMRCAITDKSHIVMGDAVASYRNYYIAEKLKNADDTARFKKVLNV